MHSGITYAVSNHVIIATNSCDYPH